MTVTSVDKPVELGPNEARLPAERADCSEWNLLERMSHEMRTPLNAILGFAQLMGSGSPSPTVSQKRNIDRILQAGWDLEKLITMTRDLALLRCGALTLSLNPVPLDEVMLDGEAMIQAQAQMRGVRVAFPVFEYPCILLADEIRLQQVIRHLLSAAIEYSAADAAVVVDYEARNSEWIRVIIDAGGEGFAAEQYSELLQGFVSPEQGSTGMAGMSIGLLLAKHLVELMGGAIGVGNSIRGRKVLWFDLKLCASECQKPPF